MCVYIFLENLLINNSNNKIKNDKMTVTESQVIVITTRTRGSEIYTHVSVFLFVTNANVTTVHVVARELLPFTATCVHA